MVGLTRVSTGPAISVMLQRRGGLPSCGHQRGGGEHLHAGLADREHVRAGADASQEMDDVGDIFVEAERAGGERHVAGVVPIGDVDVVVLQQGLDRVAQQRGEMARQRRHDQHARLGDPVSFRKWRKVANGVTSAATSVTVTSALPTRTLSMP